MGKTSSDHLFQLIHSLNSAEEKHIELFFSQLPGGAKNSARLFAAIQKQKIYDENALRKSENYVSGFAQQKQFLNRLILRALRSYPEKETKYSLAKNYLQDAETLRKKRFYIQSIALLEKALLLAKEINDPLLLLEICGTKDDVHFESNIVNEDTGQLEAELNCITRISETVNAKWLAKEMHRIHILAHNIPDKIAFSAKHKKMLKASPPESFRARFYFEKSQTTYHFIQKNLEQAYKHALSCAELLEGNPAHKEVAPHEYLRALSTILVVQEINQLADAARETIQQMRKLMSDYPEQLHSYAGHTFIYTYTTEFNINCISGNYTKAIQLIPDIVNGLKHYRSQLQYAEEVVFWYNFAQAYLCIGDYKNAFRWANDVFIKGAGHREDLVFSAGWILLLAAMKRLDKAAFLKLSKQVLEQLHEAKIAEELTAEFAEWINAMTAAETVRQKHSIMKAFHEKLLKENWNEQAVYVINSFNLIPWLEAELSGKTVSNL
jgi:hypothetical protein